MYGLHDSHSGSGRYFICLPTNCWRAYWWTWSFDKQHQYVYVKMSSFNRAAVKFKHCLRVFWVSMLRFMSA